MIFCYKRVRNLIIEGILFMDYPIGQSTLGEMLPLFIITGILLLVLVFCIKMIVTTSKIKKASKQYNKELKDKGVTCSAVLAHVNGLSIPENTLCQIHSYPDVIEIKANGISFKLDKSKLNDICVKTDVEIQSQYVSSIGGAVGGAILFGPLGAMIGGRAKNKKNRITHRYLIFTYTKDDTVKYIGFDATNALSKAIDFVNEFKDNSRNSDRNMIIDL